MSAKKEDIINKTYRKKALYTRTLLHYYHPLRSLAQRVVKKSHTTRRCTSERATLKKSLTVTLFEYLVEFRDEKVYV